MNTYDVLKYGNRTLQNTIEGLPEENWLVQGVCGWWSVKDIVAHLASFEAFLVEFLNSCLGVSGATPTLDQFKSMSGDQFNAVQVDFRKNWAVREVLDDYNQKHSSVMDLVKQISPATFRQVGLLPWYGSEYDLEDFLVYTFYGHKREHSAQINLYRDNIKR